MNYFIGDLHLFNRNQTGEGVNYDGRPFATVAEMNQYILEHWNAKITNGDTVIFLGIWPYGVETKHSSHWSRSLKVRRFCSEGITMICLITGIRSSSLTSPITAVPVAGVLRFLVWGLDALQGPVCAGR